MNTATRDYIKRNQEADTRQLALQRCSDADVDMPLALRQIAGRKAARSKLPSWASNDDILYPIGLSMEQCSSEQTASYKTDLCRRLLPSCPSPHTLIDLTGGFGVDFTLMSGVFQKATYVEQNADLFAVATSNFVTMGKSVEALCSDGIDYLHQFEGHATIIFLDPARRDIHGGRTYGIADCTPNVLDIKEELLSKADYVILKLSPMLDWHKAVLDLGQQYIKEVHVISVQNECKELLIVMEENAPKDPMLFCVNDDSTFTVALHSQPNQNAHIYQDDPSSLEGLFLYEPNASIMKAGCFNEVAAAFGVQPLATNSHLFVSDSPIADFPGREFQVSAISSMNKQELKTTLKGIQKANVTTRNFPLSVVELRKRLKLADGGTDYIFATTLEANLHVLLLCKKTTF